MREEWVVPGWAVLASVVVALVLLAALAAALRRARLDAATHATAAAEVRARVEAIERRLEEPAAPSSVAAEQEYTITTLGLGQPDAGAPVAAGSAPAVPASLFADLVLREGAVQAASLAAGLRRALAPETRSRIRIEMRREVKRARRQRRVELRRARREVAARRRSRMGTPA